MLHRLKSFLPAPLLTAYHRILAHVAALYYGNPSREMVVIGVTGTNGKTSTSYLIAKALVGAGVTTGCTTTALIKIGNDETHYVKKHEDLDVATMKVFINAMVHFIDSDLALEQALGIERA